MEINFRKRLICTLIILIELIISNNYIHAQSLKTKISVLSIGNAHYKDTSLMFNTIKDINTSSSDFLQCFLSFSTPCLLQSSVSNYLSKEKILSTINNFVEFVEKREAKTNLGIIYYCGHGMANKSGSMYFVPGDLDFIPKDTTFEYLSNSLINIDEITKIIIEAQMDSLSHSKYIILADCCSNRNLSKLYEGITFKFNSDGTGNVEYDSTRIRNIKPGSILWNSAFAQIDTLGNIVLPQLDSTVSTDQVNDEFNFFPELIRSYTFEGYGNLIYYSSELGKTTEMVSHPNLKKYPKQIGPICRRTIIYFNNKKSNNLNDYFEKLSQPGFDKLTDPVLLNRERK